MSRTVNVEFFDREAFVHEYHRNLANGGIFVPTSDSFEPREVIEVDLDLRFCERVVTLQAEVVSSIGYAQESSGARRGVAAQFLMSADEVRALLGDIVGIAPPPPPQPDRAGPLRVEERVQASVNARISYEGGEVQGRTRNLSRSGALLTTEGPPIPVGTPVWVTLIHPSSREEVRLAGEIVRHAESDGHVVGMGVHFEPSTQTQGDTSAVLDGLRAAAHAHQLVGIRGPVQALGLPSLLQMFGSAAEGGTLSVVRGEVEGRAVIEGGTLRHCSVGSVTGLKALARMMSWEDGEFWFLPKVDPDGPADEPIALYGAVLEAVTQLDEIRRLDLGALPSDARVSRQQGVAVPVDLEKLESTLLELAGDGAPVAALIDAVPEFDAEAYAALLSLLEQELISVAD